jgi:hypothetical protein
MDKKHKTIINILLVAILVVIAVGGSYAYFTANITGTETSTTITTSAGTMTIAFADSNAINLSDIYPRDASWASKTFTLNGTNTTDLNMGYSLSLVVDSNSFSTGALKYTFISVNTGGSGTVIASNATQTSIANGASTIPLGTGNYVKASNIIHTYTLNIYFPNNTTTNQNADQGKTFVGHIGISEVH